MLEYLSFLPAALSKVAPSVSKEFRIPSASEIDTQLNALESIEEACKSESASSFPYKKDKDLLSLEDKRNASYIAKEAFYQEVRVGPTIAERQEERWYLFLWSSLLACTIVFVSAFFEVGGWNEEGANLTSALNPENALPIAFLVLFSIFTIRYFIVLSKHEYIGLYVSRGGRVRNMGEQTEGKFLKILYIVTSLLLFFAFSLLIMMLIIILCGAAYSVLPIEWREAINGFFGVQDGDQVGYLKTYLGCLFAVVVVDILILLVITKFGFMESLAALGNLRLCTETDYVAHNNTCELTPKDFQNMFRRASLSPFYFPIRATRFKKDTFTVYGEVGEKVHRIDVIQLPGKEGKERWRNDRIRVISSPSLSREEMKERLGDAYGFLAIIDRW